MRTIPNLLHEGHSFKIGEEIFQISQDTLVEIKDIGFALTRFMQAMQIIVHLVMSKELCIYGSKTIRTLLFGELNSIYRLYGGMHPNKGSSITRVDFMIDDIGRLKIAEVDPMNKHGLGFALATRDSSGFGDNQKILSHITRLMKEFRSLLVIISKRDRFYSLEQKYFAKRLSEYSGKPVKVCGETETYQINESLEDSSVCFLDCPIISDMKLSQNLLDVFETNPDRFLVPPKYWMGNKAVMAFLHEPVLLRVLSAFLGEKDIKLLQTAIPPTYTTKPENGRYVAKKVMSSGAKGVYFEGKIPKTGIVFQKYVHQARVVLDDEEKYVRLAAHYVGALLSELTVTGTDSLPVHGGPEAVNYHVGLQCES